MKTLTGRFSREYKTKNRNGKKINYLHKTHLMGQMQIIEELFGFDSEEFDKAELKYENYLKNI